MWGYFHNKQAEWTINSLWSQDMVWKLQSFHRRAKGNGINKEGDERGGGDELTLEQRLWQNLERQKVKILRHEIMKSGRTKWRSYYTQSRGNKDFPTVKLKLASKAQGGNETWNKYEGFEMNSYQLPLSLYHLENKTTPE